jgi:hypothetical protein
VIPEVEGQREQSEQYEERQFIQKANSFVRIWTEFTKEYNEKKTFNAKLASKLTRAFHELETSSSWPRAGSRKTHHPRQVTNISHPSGEFPRHSRPERRS